MPLTIDLSPTDQARLDAAAREKGVAPAELARELVTHHLPPTMQKLSVRSGNDAPTVALLQSWLEEDATDDPEEVRKAQEELDEFKQGINAERDKAGSRRVYP